MECDGRISEIILNNIALGFLVQAEGGRKKYSLCGVLLLQVSLQSCLHIASLSFSVCSLKFVFKLSSRLLLYQHSAGPPPSLQGVDPQKNF